MIFNSFSYLIFFPIVTLIYFVVPSRIRWVWLLVSSYYFYMNWHAEYALLMAASTVVTYGCALLVDRFKEKKHRKLVLILGILFNVGMLGYFKYTGMIVDLIGRIMHAFGSQAVMPKVDILLPVGISFFTFQALGYLIDVYKRRVKPETNLFRYALFISFFPQLVAGPIERSGRLMRQLAKPHNFDARRARDGLLIMLLGFFEKVVIADRAAIYVNAIFGNWIQASGAQIALATAVFAIQDLCDFAGYSYIAIGTAKVLGIELMTNFRQPYFAHSVQNFWARWHISLSSWFRDYIYFPLGAGRGSKPRQIFNLMVVFTISGLWHGAALKFVFWGMLNGALQVAESFFPPMRPKRFKKLHHFACVMRTNFFILITMLIFRATSLTASMQMLWRIPTAWNAPALEANFSPMQVLCLGICTVILFAIELLHEKHKTLTELTVRLPCFVRGILYLLAVMGIVIFGIWGPGYSAQAFIYFQF